MKVSDFINTARNITIYEVIEQPDKVRLYNKATGIKVWFTFEVIEKNNFNDMARITMRKESEKVSTGEKPKTD